MRRILLIAVIMGASIATLGSAVIVAGFRLSSQTEAKTPAREGPNYWDAPSRAPVNYLSLQDLVGKLGAVLEKRHRGTFGGLSIEYEPGYHIVVRTTERVASYPQFSDRRFSPLDEYIVLRLVRFSLADLRAALREFLKFAPPVRFNAEIDIDLSRIVIVAGTNEDVTTLRDAVTERRYAVPAEAFTVRRGALGGPMTSR